jgi:Flp pilus assembly protein TadG
MRNAQFPRLKPLRRDERGASMVEFALFVPILAVMVMGITDVSMGYSRKLTYEQAAYRALERVAVGSVQSDYSYLRPEAAAAAGVPVANVTVDNWLECDGVRQTSFDGVCPDTQMVSRYVRIAITGTYTPSFDYGPLARGFGGANGTVPISASASLRIQ